jgi:hypothetical protein
MAIIIMHLSTGVGELSVLRLNPRPVLGLALLELDLSRTVPGCTARVTPRAKVRVSPRVTRVVSHISHSCSLILVALAITVVTLAGTSLVGVVR